MRIYFNILFACILAHATYERVLAQGVGSLVTGVIATHVVCQSDTNYSYAAYLPSGYTSERTWPVIFIFEPMANGPLPVHRYHYAAEKLGYVLIASNNSKNGNWDISLQSAKAMFEDAFSALKLDSNRVYLSGFSGGSRVASALACLQPGVAGVIGCGAGFVSTGDLKPSMKYDWLYVGIVGDVDMNFRDQLNAKLTLDRLEIENRLIVFGGTHDWPDSTILLSGLEWIHLNAMKRGLISRNEKFILDKFNKERSAIESKNVSGNELETNRCLLQLANAFKGLMDVEEINSQIMALEESKRYISALKKITKIYSEEDALLYQMQNDLFSLRAYRKDSAFMKEWDHQLNTLARLSKSKNKEVANMNKRVLNNLSYVCADLTVSQICLNIQDALMYGKYWLKMQPEGPWVYWYLARIYATLDQEGSAIRHLEKAQSLGVLNKSMIESESSFKSLRDKKGFQKLLSELS